MCGKVCWEAGFSVSGRRQGPAFQPVCRGGRVQMPEQVDRPVAAMRSGDSLLLCSLCGRIVGNSSVLRQDGFGGCGSVRDFASSCVTRPVSVRVRCRSAVRGARLAPGLVFAVAGAGRAEDRCPRHDPHGPESQMRGFTAMRSSSDSA